MGEQQRHNFRLIQARDKLCFQKLLRETGIVLSSCSFARVSGFAGLGHQILRHNHPLSANPSIFSRCLFTTMQACLPKSRQSSSV